MEIPGSLEILAEIGVAFAGFSGLVIALRKNPGPLTDVQKYRLRVLLTLAFGAMFLSFLPELLLSYGTSPEMIWPCASAVSALFSVSFLAWWLAKSRQIMRKVPEIFNGFALARMAAGHLAIIVLLLAGIAWSGNDFGSAPFVTALVWYLMHAAQQFSRMLFIQPVRDD